MVRLFGIGREPRTFEFRCECCGKLHRGSPSFGYRRPEHVFEVPEEERADRVHETDDLCVIQPDHDQPEEATSYWIRATLDVPIHGVDEPFCWGVWVSQSKESFDRYRETYGDDQSGQGSFGWLPVPMAYYRNDDGSWPTLECDVHWGPPGKRPTIQLWECDDRLFLDQNNGISWETAIAIATPMMHSS